MAREISDEEEDQQTLIHTNNNTQLPNHSFTFHIDESKPRMNSNLSINKRLLFAIFLPLFILIVYFSTNIRDFFSTSVNSSSLFVTNTNLMRESELHALYLLKQQQSSLFTLWNSTSNPTSNDLKSALLKQISLNREIQMALLSSHRSGNLSELEDRSEFDTCQKVDRNWSGRRTIEWNPRSNKYLFAICVSGQTSNHLICLEKHMFFAALLNRILVIPSSKVDYNYSHVLDVDHINSCLGRKVVITFEEFAELKKNHMHIDRVMCYFSLPQLCYLDDDHVKKLESLGLSTGKLKPVWVEDIKNPTKKTVQDVLAKFSSSGDDDVIAIGDVFYADLEKEWFMQPGGPLAHKCKTLIEPSRLIILTAKRFVQTFLGKNFVALHFRRHGFLTFCNAKETSCFFPIPQAAECISRVVDRGNVPIIYLSTDAADSETGLLQSLIVTNGKIVPLVKRPPRNSAEKWDALLYRHGLEEDTQVEAMLDKTICAMSSVFIGAPGSTFTEDILRLRKDWGSASVCDEYLCQGELPNFIAENE